MDTPTSLLARDEVQARIDDLRCDIADMQRSQRRASGMGCQLRALAADPEFSALSRETFGVESAIQGMQADGYSANIARARAQIAELETKLTHGAFFNRIMDGQYAAMDETGGLL